MSNLRGPSFRTQRSSITSFNIQSTLGSEEDQGHDASSERLVKVLEEEEAERMELVFATDNDAFDLIEGWRRLRIANKMEAKRRDILTDFYTTGPRAFVHLEGLEDRAREQIEDVQDLTISAFGAFNSALVALYAEEAGARAQIKGDYMEGVAVFTSPRLLNRTRSWPRLPIQHILKLSQGILSSSLPLHQQSKGAYVSVLRDLEALEMDGRCAIGDMQLAQRRKLVDIFLLEAKQLEAAAASVKLRHLRPVLNSLRKAVQHNYYTLDETPAGLLLTRHPPRPRKREWRAATATRKPSSPKCAAEVTQASLRTVFGSTSAGSRHPHAKRITRPCSAAQPTQSGTESWVHATPAFDQILPDRRRSVFTRDRDKGNDSWLASLRSPSHHNIDSHTKASLRRHYAGLPIPRRTEHPRRRVAAECF